MSRYLMLLLLLAGCATRPTTVIEQPERKMESASRLLEPARINKDTLVIDARPRFEYSLAHIPRAISLSWTDFTEAEKAQRGVMQSDLFAASRRLARYGISPSSDVVVVGAGKSGGAEEGRIAWMLAYLGVTQVRFADMNSFRANLSNIIDETWIKSVPIWKPEPIESLNATRAELLFVINKRGVETPVAFRPGSASTLYRLIDVRSEKAYLGREGLGSRRKIPNMDAINIPWQEFFESDMRPATAMAARLRAIGVEPSQRLIVLDEDGVASGAVTMALRALGFDKAANYSGGLNDLLSVGGSGSP